VHLGCATALFILLGAISLFIFPRDVLPDQRWRANWYMALGALIWLSIILMPTLNWLAASFYDNEHVFFILETVCVMAFAASSDLLTMTIANRVSIILVAGFAALAVLTGMSASGLLSHVGAAATVLIGEEWPQVKIKTLATREETLVSHEDLLAKAGQILHLKS